MKSLLFYFLLFCSATLFAQQPGTLDPSFGNKGVILENSPSVSTASSIVVSKAGKIFIGTFGPYKGFNHTFRIDAFSPDGSADISFGEKGSAYVLFPGMTQSDNSASISSLVLFSDGKILASGNLDASGTTDDIAFARFTDNGAIDSSFGTNGTATASFGYQNESAGSLTLQSNGDFLIGGNVFTDFDQNIYKFYTARFLPNGSKDESYGNGGIVLSGTRGVVTGIALQKDGKIVAAGFSGNYYGSAKFHIERYNANGSYDESFGSNGIIDAKIGNSNANVINDIAIGADEKITVTGKTGGQSNEPVLTVARYNTDGSLDNSFGNSGIVITPLPEYGGEGLQVWLSGEKEDKIIIAGNNLSYFDNYGNFALIGYNADGSLDPEFGNGGIQITDFGGIDNVTAAALQPDGKVILTGYSQSLETFESYRAFARYYGYPQKVSLIVRIKRWLQNHTLSWKGLPTEDKIAYYTVEQSANGTSGFAQVAKVSGAANLKDYSITNSHLLQGNNYYRIKAVSIDGVVRYSEVVSADNTANTASVFPNPAKNYVTVQGLPNNETANISIKDGSGTVLARGVSTGSAQYRSPLNNMQPGTYYLNITTAAKTEVLKFVKE